MRYVDLDELELRLPDGWQADANAALNALRTEIFEAEANAIRLSLSVAEARKAAITAGLAKAPRQRIWQMLKAALAGLRNEKCWYSESLNPTSDKDVDHFRPKNRVLEEPTHEGYWWLAFDWRNFRYSAQWCNQRRVGDTEGGKADHFPLCTGSFRAFGETDNYHHEEPKLLDPTDPDDWRLLTFRLDGQIMPSAVEGTHAYERAQCSIQVFHLHCRALVSDRRVLASEIRRKVQMLDELFVDLATPTARVTFKGLQKELLRDMSSRSAYSAAARVFAKGELYKLEQGIAVKREWLDDLLGAPIE